MSHSNLTIVDRDVSSKHRVFVTVDIDSFGDPETFTSDEVGLSSISWISVVGGDDGNGIYYDGDSGLDGAAGATTINNVALEFIGG